MFANNANEGTLNEADVIASAETVDAFSAAVSSVAPLDIMPGCKDPTGIMLPQKPFHYCELIENIVVCNFYLVGAIHHSIIF